MKRLIQIIKNPKIAIMMLYCKLSRFIISDTLYLKGLFRLFLGEKLDLKNPKTFNQKTQWLKLHNTDERFTQMVDKFGVREIIEKEIGKEHLIPLLGVWNEFDDIDFNKLPNQFVLKTTHDSGSTVICKDKSTFNIKSARKILNSAKRKNYFYPGREYPYKNVKPRIICEQCMVDESGTELKDYKFLCFNGEPKIFLVGSNRFVDVNIDFYDLELNRLPFTTGKYSHSSKPVTKIKSFNTMIEIAKKLSKGIPFVRVDLYNVNGKIYFGEFTFHHDGGINTFHPQDWDRKLGDLIRLPFE
jgi:hypothetical protein